MKRAFAVAGVALLLFGGLFTLQGAGIVHWPRESFMLDQSVWITRGAIVMVAGAVLLLLSRRV